MLGCGGEETTAASLVVPEGCNPLSADTHCLLPYPTDHFLDTSTQPPQVRTPQPAWPVANGVPFDLLERDRPSGFSIGTPILAVFGEAIDPQVQLAWDSTTRPEHEVTRDMLAVRDDVLAQLETEDPE